MDSAKQEVVELRNRAEDVCEASHEYPTDLSGLRADREWGERFRRLHEAIEAFDAASQQDESVERAENAEMSRDRTLGSWMRERRQSQGRIDRLLSALRTIRGPEDRGPWMIPYRLAGGGYAGLQAIAKEALMLDETDPQDSRDA